jgi:hypothetical protein
MIGELGGNNHSYGAAKMTIAGIPYVSDIEKGLGATEKLIGLLRQLVGVVIPAYSEAASGLEQVCKKLLDANESTVRWINSFRDFDFTSPNAIEKFRTLAGEYRALKTGRRYQELKFDCGEIETIYRSNLRGKLRNLFGGSRLKEAEQVFDKLSKADASLVQFVHTEVFGQLDSICKAAEAAIEKHDFQAAETARLQFKVRSDSLTRRLQEIGDGLAELVLEFRKVTMSASPNPTLQQTRPVARARSQKKSKRGRPGH